MDAKRKRRSCTIIVVLLSVVVSAGGLLGWLLIPHQPMEEALAVLSERGQTVRQTPDWIHVAPDAAPNRRGGLILYPGARVDAEAYAPLAGRLADRGFDVFLVRMPLRLAVLAADRAERVMQEHQTIGDWVLCGHSMGGAMAARFAARHERVHHLVLLGAWPAESLRELRPALPVLSIQGTADRIASPDEIEEHAQRLPEEARILTLKGANHAGFGHYGPQRGDGTATLSRAGQQALVARAIDRFVAGRTVETTEKN